MTCTARHDYAYGGRLAGDALAPRTIPQPLSDGRAWGRAVAVWHAEHDTLLGRINAHAALHDSLDDDWRTQYGAGVPVPYDDVIATQERLDDTLAHYMDTVEPLPNLTRLEDDIDVPIPSRNGRTSNLYRFQGRIDGYTIIDGNQWLVEFKLRRQLQPVELIQLMPQYKWYGWALGRQQNWQWPFGILIDERLNEAPRQPRILKGRGKYGTPTPSHDSGQLITAEAYLEVCAEYRVQPSATALDKFEGYRWQQRVPIQYSEQEMDDAGRELVSAAKLIHDLDSFELYPVRNASVQNCQGCRFRQICPQPSDRGMVDLLFERRPPKRLRSSDGTEVR